MGENCLKILFVCMGNICRSPTAECLFRTVAEAQGLQDHFYVDSAGTGGWHAGAQPDRRMRAAAKKTGNEIKGSARQVTIDDFSRFDWIFCMDQDNYDDLIGMGAIKKKTALLLPFVGNEEIREVPDPYYGGKDGFKNVVALIDDAVHRLVDILS